MRFPHTQERRRDSCSAEAAARRGRPNKSERARGCQRYITSAGAADSARAASVGRPPTATQRGRPAPLDARRRGSSAERQHVGETVRRSQPCVS
jgi:hypothetical protein